MLPELAVVRVVHLNKAERHFDGSAGVSRAPRIGDIGTIVHVGQTGAGPVYAVECIDQEGYTVWLTDFTEDEFVALSDDEIAQLEKPSWLDYCFTLTAAPVQAEGTVNANRFYFRARHDEWTFGVSEDPSVDPVDIDTPAKGSRHGFFASGHYGAGQYDASYMPLSEARKIIEEAARAYLHAKGKDAT